MGDPYDESAQSPRLRTSTLQTLQQQHSTAHDILAMRLFDRHKMWVISVWMSEAAQDLRFKNKFGSALLDLSPAPASSLFKGTDMHLTSECEVIRIFNSKAHAGVAVLPQFSACWLCMQMMQCEESQQHSPTPLQAAL